MKMLKSAYEEAKRLLSENREALDQIAAFLIEKETITGKEFMKIFREVKGLPEPDEKDTAEKRIMDRQAEPARVIEPVSYTHLDVYKRQPYSASPPDPVPDTAAASFRRQPEPTFPFP